LAGRRNSGGRTIAKRSHLPLTLARFFSFLFCLCLTVQIAYSASDPANTARNSQTRVTPAIVIGFVGGFVHRDDARHSEVQLAEKLHATYSGTRVEVFENRQRDLAHHAILDWLDRDKDGDLSNPEKQEARIILFGHSWGAAAALVLARELQKDGIPVLLTVQVDSIAKKGQDDRIVPANVAKAINFYQTRGLLHGRKKITAADPAKTQILGDVRFDYDAGTPAECKSYPWYDRYFFKGHTAIECDPHVWSQIEGLIAGYLAHPDSVSSEAALR